MYNTVFLINEIEVDDETYFNEPNEDIKSVYMYCVECGHEVALNEYCTCQFYEDTDSQFYEHDWELEDWYASEDDEYSEE